MRVRTRCAAALCLLLTVFPASRSNCATDAATFSALEIMARVAANQDRAQQQREEYIYHQRIHIATRKTNGSLIREETADYLVTPNPAGTRKELNSISGRYWHKRSYVDFEGEPVPEQDSLDGDLIHDLRDDLMNDKSKDSLGHDLFPLTAEQQKRYRFELAGEATVRKRKAYRIRFYPADKEEFTWAGEALVDQEEFQPLTVSTRLSRKIPLLVRTVLGTDLPGLGFNVEYQRFGEGVWFPASFGTEFRLRAVFFINREIIISLENSDFKHAKAESRIIEYKPVQ